MELLLLLWLMSMPRMNYSLPSSAQKMILSNGFRINRQHNNNSSKPVMNDADRILPAISARMIERENTQRFPIKKLPLRGMVVVQHGQKRLSLYPTIDMDNNEQHPSSSPSLPKYRAWQKGRSMLWLGHRRETHPKQNGKFDRVRESIQTCLFLRSGCEKIQRGHSTHRLASFMQNLDVQERISNGFVLQRNKKKKKKKTRQSRLL